jgi:IclR family pca regulon transcriptional regulator
MTSDIKKSDFIQSLEKGLKVISVFDRAHPRLTLTEVAKELDLTRANARRILLTLTQLGYVKTEDNKHFSLTAKVLSLGYAYLSGLPFRDIAQPFMEDLAAAVNESCSMAVWEGQEIVYIARVHTQRIMTLALGVGTRLPLHATSMGKVLLAGLPTESLDQIVADIAFETFTPYSIMEPETLLAQIDEVRAHGWALSDQELELGVRSIACPIRDQAGHTIAALNISGHAGRVSLSEMTERFLPALRQCVDQIEAALKHL